MERLVWTIGGFLLALAFCAQTHGQIHGPPLHPWETPCVDGQCQPNTFNYGFYQTHWRRWPTSLPRVEAGPAARGGGLESLPRVETPDPRFEGEISPPHESTSPSPPTDTPPDASPELPAPELPDPFSPPPRDSRIPPPNPVSKRLNVPPPPPLDHSTEVTARTARAIAEPAAISTVDPIEPLPPQDRTTSPHLPAGQIRLATHEQPAVELRIVSPPSSASGEITPAAPPVFELSECVIEEEAAPAPTIALPPPPVIPGPVSGRRSTTSKPTKPRDLLFDSLRATPVRDPLFKAIR